MTDDKEIFSTGFSRRGFFTAAGAASAVAVLAGATPASAADNKATLPSAVGDPLTTPVVNGLHLQFGTDASSEVVVSWHTLQPVKQARAMLGETDGSYGRSQDAVATSYVDAKSGQKIYAYHAKLTELDPSHDYVYAAIHDGAQPEFGSFRTGPRGRGKFTFTSFGDQGTPTLGKKSSSGSGTQQWVNDNLGSPAAGDMPAGVERVQPLFHLFNGDLCYANISREPGADLDRLLGQQLTQRPSPAMDARGGKPRERTGQRSDRICRLPDVLLRPAAARADRPHPRPLVLLHRRFSTGHQPRQRRRLLPGRRQQLRQGLLEGRPENLARK